MMSVDDSRVAQAPVAPGTRVRLPLVGAPPYGAAEWPCYPVLFREIEVSDLVVCGSYVCKVMTGSARWLNVRRSRYYLTHLDKVDRYYETRYTIHREQSPYVWKYDLETDLSV
jgi:hypothetical protein